MRKDTLRKPTAAVLKTVDGYHANSSWSGNYESYAFQGFGENRYFTSDRYEKLGPNFERLNGKALKGFGLEIEMECSGVTDSDILCHTFDKIIADEFPEHLFKYQHDGSLGGRSNMEAITQVMTKEFIRNHYPEFKLMYDTYFPAYQISCSASGNCGMHVNCSVGLFGTTEAKQKEALRKLYYIINKHFSLFTIALCRNPNKTDYCGKMDYSDAKRIEPEYMSGSHYNCLNYSHFAAGRIEIRLVGGQPTFGAFRNTMETIFHLVDAVKKLSWSDCDDITKIFSGCNYHVFDRLKTNCLRAGVITLEEVEKIKATANLEVRYI